MIGTPGSADVATAPAGRRLLPTVAFCLAVFFALLQLSKWPARLRYPGGAESVEGQQMAEMLHLRQGRSIYEPADSDQFDAAIYGPLYYLLGAKLLHPSRPSYFPLRIVSLLATLAALGGCASLAFWVTRDRSAAILAPLVCLGTAFVEQPAVSAGCDATAGALSFGGFLLAYRFRSSRLILCSTAPMLLAFFYKQLFVGAPLGVFVYLLIERRYRIAAQFAGLLAAGILSVVALCQFVLFRDQAFLLHFLVYNVLPFRSHYIVYGLASFFAMLGIPLAGATYRLLRRRDKLLACYVACVTLVPLLAVGKEGSTVKYFVECSIVLFTLLACEITRRDRTAPGSAAWFGLLVIALGLNHAFPIPSPSPADFAQDKALQLFLREHFPPGTPAVGYYTGDLVRAGLEAPNTNVWHYVQLVRQGTLSGNGFLKEIQGRKFGAIVLEFDLKPNRHDPMANHNLTADFRAAILTNYCLLAVLPMPPLEKTGFNEGHVFIWVPRVDVRAGGRRDC